MEMFPDCFPGIQHFILSDEKKSYNTITIKYEKTGLKSSILSTDDHTIFMHSFTIVNCCQNSNESFSSICTNLESI